MIDAFAMSAGISFDKVKEILGSNGQNLAMAIHHSHTAASHAKNQQIGAALRHKRVETFHHLEEEQ